jgi:hypothetical protein
MYFWRCSHTFHHSLSRLFFVLNLFTCGCIHVYQHCPSTYFYSFVPEKEIIQYAQRVLGIHTPPLYYSAPPEHVEAT